MPDSRSRRLKQLEQRVEQIAPGKRELFYMRVLHEQYEEAKAILQDLPAAGSESTDPLEPSTSQSQPEELVRPPRAVPSQEDEESSDRARLKYLRELSRAAERKDWHGNEW